MAEDVPSALREMEAVAAGSRSRGNFMYQANINPREGEVLTPEQWAEAVDTLERNMGLEGHQRVVVEHEKEGRIHRHVMWNRVDVDTLRVADIGGNYYTHERTARELEGRFDLAHTPSLHGVQRPEGRPERAPELSDIRAEERSGINRRELRTEITALWRSTDSGKAFAAALEDRGYILARGDSRDFVVVDHAGDAHSLARRIDGAKAANVRERMADLDRDSLPTAAEARAEQGERYPTQGAALAAFEAAQPLNTIEKVLDQAAKTATNGTQFLQEIGAQGFTLARATGSDLTYLQAEAAAAFEDDRTFPNADKIAEGELVAVNRSGGIHVLNPYRLDTELCVSLVKEGGGSVLSIETARTDALDVRESIADHWADVRATRDAKAFARATEPSDARDSAAATPEPDVESAIDRAAQGAAKGAFMVAEAFANAALKLFDFVEAMFGGGPPPPPPDSQVEQLRAQRRALAALERISESIKNEQPIAAGDIRSLTPTHLQGIREGGDEYLKILLERMETDRKHEQEREDWGRARER